MIDKGFIDAEGTLIPDDEPVLLFDIDDMPDNTEFPVLVPVPLLDKLLNCLLVEDPERLLSCLPVEAPLFSRLPLLR